ncbi:hypothetical protein FJC35_12480 [Salmonella enterica]|nr:hypothetical protein [Salmonella enterica]
MKKIITCALVAVAAAVAQPAFAVTFNNTTTTGNAGPKTTSTSFTYDSQAPTTAPVYATSIVKGNETKNHGVVADTTFVVPTGVVSAKLEHVFTGVNSGVLEATLSDASTSVANVNDAVQALTGGETLHILLQNTAGSALQPGATTITYNVTSYTN